MRYSTSLVLTISLLLAAPLAYARQPLARSAETAAFQQMAASIPLGSRVKVRTTDGRRMTATLMAADDHRIVLKRLSRVPEPAVALTFTDLAELRRDEPNGFSVGKAIGIGLAAGVGAILTLFAIAVTIDD